MPGPETFERNQKAVLWSRIGTDRHGNPKLASPIELDVRWEENEVVATDPLGDVIKVDTTVVVDRPIIVGSLMRRGTLEGLVGTGTSPITPEDDSMEVRLVERIPDIKDREVYRRCLMIRKGSTLPS